MHKKMHKESRMGVNNFLPAIERFRAFAKEIRSVAKIERKGWVLYKKASGAKKLLTPELRRKGNMVVMQR